EAESALQVVQDGQELREHRFFAGDRNLGELPLDAFLIVLEIGHGVEELVVVLFRFCFGGLELCSKVPRRRSLRRGGVRVGLHRGLYFASLNSASMTSSPCACDCEGSSCGAPVAPLGACCSPLADAPDFWYSASAILYEACCRRSVAALTSSAVP